MILALAVAFFILGFTAASTVASRPGKQNAERNGLVLPLKSASGNLRKLIERYFDSSFLQPNVEHAPSEGPSQLLSKEQVETQFEPSSWQYLAYEDFKTVMLARDRSMKTFPCIYATMGYRSNEHRYLFCKSDNPSEPQNIRRIAPALEEYLRTSRTLGANTSLLIICAPSEQEKSVEDYNSSFWDMLRGLRMVDKSSWPEDVPEEVQSEKWTFCFGGQQVFPVMLTPAHTQRWSRHMSVPIIALQPKWVLDQLLGTPEKRISAQDKVRKLLKEYDQVDVSPDLTSFGEPGTTEARQLCLLDENRTVDCPYRNFDR